MPGLESTFKTTYDKVADREFNMKGRYYRVALRDDITNRIKALGSNDPASKSCGDFLRAQLASGTTYYPIYSISVIELDSASYIGDIVSKVTADFAAKVQAVVPAANIGILKAGLSNEIKTKLNVEIGRERRVIAWDYMSLPGT